jgi:hypothetical protein
VTDAPRVAKLKEMAAQAREEVRVLPHFVRMAGQKQIKLLNELIEQIEAI